MANTVAFHEVGKRFGAVTAIDGVSFEIAGGETVALLGPSGCGKTTILRVIAGFERPDIGSVSIAGADVTRLKPYERNVGLLFQHYALFPHMNVAGNIAYGLRHRGFPKASIPQRVEEMLELVRLPGFGHRRPDQLSGGQQQRVALARALATRPGLVLLDEPLSALDAKLRQDLRAELKQVLAAVGSTAIVVTHDQEEAMSLGQRIFVMNGGRIVQSGAPDDVYRRPNSRFVADFMGRANWFRGHVEERGEELTVFRSDCGLELMVERPPAPQRGEIDLCLRPESLDLLPADTPAPGTHNHLTGKVTDIALLGAMRQLVVTLASGAGLLVLKPNRTGDAIAQGQEVTVSFPVADCVLVPSSGNA